jgi:uncharacterized membrane protein YccC
MRVPLFRATWSQFSESRALSVELPRATRATVAFMLPLIFLPHLGWPLSASFVALGAQSISTIDVRGAYSLRVGLLAVVSIVFAAYAAIGALVAGHVWLAVGATIVLTVLAGIWRHLSSDYGASVLIASLLMFFLGLVGPPGLHTAEFYASSLAAGCALAILLHTLFWPFRPQHPLRHAVAESWLAAGNLFAALAPVPAAQRAGRHDKIVETETNLRATIDKTALFVIQASGNKTQPILTQLEALNLCAARLSLAIDTFNAALEGCLSSEDWERIAPTFDPVLTTLTNTARTIALTVVSRDPGHLATARIRLRRAEGLLKVFALRMQNETSLNAYHQQLVDIVSEISKQLPEVIATLDSTIERSSERSAFTSELFNLDTWMLRPLAATLNLGQKPDGALIRYILRLTLLTSIGVWAFQYFNLPHGYWLPFTMVVILQPDFGATRQRAAQRVAGTLAGSVVATALIWLHPPGWMDLTIIGIAAFSYAYIVRRNYGVAIFFVTVFVVILLEGGSGGHAHVAIERVIATCCGAILAFIAAAIFWPKWERDRFPDALAGAFRANADYLAHLAPSRGEAAIDSVEKSHRAVERAHAVVFASLRRMFGDPHNRREGIEQMAALANGSQRLTRVLNVVFAHFQPAAGAHVADIEAFCTTAEKFLNALADQMAHRKIEPEILSAFSRAVEIAVPKVRTNDSADADSRWLFFQCGRAATELSALAVIAQGDLQIRPSDQMPAPTGIRSHAAMG